MSETTDRLALPLLAAGQAQKEMSHNEALVRIDLLTQAHAEAVGIDVPPENPRPGQCWITGADPAGAWSGYPRHVAGWTEGGWRFVGPREGMRLWIGRNSGFAVFAGGAWRSGETCGRLIVEGEQVVGPRMSAIAEPVGGPVVDAPARAALHAVLDVLRGHGLIEGDGL